MVDIDVWWAPVDWPTRGMKAWLDAGELERMASYRNEEARDRFVAGALLLREAVARTTGLDPGSVTVDRACLHCAFPHGRPRIRDVVMEGSVTHSGALVGVALCQAAPVGVDAERVTGFPGGGATGCLPTALGLASGRWSERQLLHQWTRVESVVKATGDGLAVGAEQIKLSEPNSEPRLLEYRGRPGLVAKLLDMSPGDGYVASVAVLDGQLPRVREYYLP